MPARQRQRLLDEVRLALNLSAGRRDILPGPTSDTALDLLRMVEERLPRLFDHSDERAESPQ